MSSCLECWRILWKLSLFAGVWKILLERNNRVFQNKVIKVDEVVDSIFWTTSEWANCNKEFSSVSLHALSLSWEACINGGRMKSLVIHSSWLCRLFGLLKLNFDGVWQRWFWRGLQR